jgi:hypothetical protein
VLPAVHLGTEYVAVTSTSPDGYANMIAVVAYQDNTQVICQCKLVSTFYVSNLTSQKSKFQFFSIKNAIVIIAFQLFSMFSVI